jgi:hypothetical protein
MDALITPSPKLACQIKMSDRQTKSKPRLILKIRFTNPRMLKEIKRSWDDWVTQDRMRKDNPDNRELQKGLRAESEAARKPQPTKSATTSRKKALGSDLSSGRGSEDRQSSVPAGGRGTKRGRENDIEKVGGSNLKSSSWPLKQPTTHMEGII